MISWKNYYEENERRMDRMDEARQHRLIQACLNLKNSRTSRFPAKIQPKLDTKIKEVGL